MDTNHLFGRIVRWAGRIYYRLSECFYDELAWAFDGVTRCLTFGAISRWRRVALEYLPESRVLDVGCGTGDLLLELSEQASELVGLDISPGMQRAFVNKVRRKGKCIPFVLGNARDQPFACASFNAIVASFPTNYLNELRVLEELSRVLKPCNCRLPDRAGRLVVVGMYLCSECEFARKVLNALYGASPGVLIDQFNDLAKEAGFDVTVHFFGEGIFQIPVMVARKAEC